MVTKHTDISYGTQYKDKDKGSHHFGLETTVDNPALIITKAYLNNGTQNKFTPCHQYTSHLIINILVPHTLSSIYLTHCHQYTSHLVINILHTLSPIYLTPCDQYTSHLVINIPHTLSSIYLTSCHQCTSHLVNHRICH